MEKHGWKILAIVFICLFIVENLFIGWGYSLVIEEEQKMNECYYDICEDYAEAEFVDNVCGCYSYDFEAGEYVLEKTETMYN